MGLNLYREINNRINDIVILEFYMSALLFVSRDSYIFPLRYRIRFSVSILVKPNGSISS